MARKFAEEFDVLLIAVDRIEGSLAVDVLRAAGIPAWLHAPDANLSELGLSLHVPEADVLVPRGACVAARAALVEAWGADAVTRLAPTC